MQEIVLNAEEPKQFCSPVDREHVDLQEAERILNRLKPDKYGDTNLKDLPKVEKLELSVKAFDFGLTYPQLTTLMGLNETAIYRSKLKSSKTAEHK